MSESLLFTAGVLLTHDNDWVVKSVAKNGLDATCTVLDASTSGGSGGLPAIMKNVKSLETE